MNRIVALFVVVLATALAGCTRSLESQYSPSYQPVSSTATAASAKIGVARLEDKRSWVNPGDEKSKSFVAQAGSWKFGLSFAGKEYTPSDLIVRSAISDEFRRLGASITPIEMVLGSADIAKYDAAGTAAKVDYVLGGDLVVFEFVNETGLVTVTSRRGVSLNLKMKRVGAARALIDQNYSQNDRENEGLGVMHSTNVNKLMNGALKSVVHKLVTDVATALNLPENKVSVAVEFDGVALQD